MELSELAAATGAEVSGEASVPIAGLAYRSDLVEPGALFFCVRGLTADGHDFAPDAVRRGAGALCVERPLDLGVPELRVPDARRAMAPAAAAFHGDPTHRLAVAGVTGTNGKTTTCFLVRHLAERAGIRCGLMGTVRQVVGGAEEEVVRTTPEAIDLQETFARMRDGGDRACAMEVSSHALELHRADAIRFRVACFTNLTQDHLDFHPDMDAYFAAKSRLFEPGRAGERIVNIDDPWGERLAADVPCRTVSASGDPRADWRAADVSLDAGGASFALEGPDVRADVVLPLPGEFNVQNALIAVAAAVELGVAPEQAAEALAEAPPVPGRMEPIDEGQRFAVLVDYAHTPDSLENVLRAARDLAPGRVICVFGCGGDRDRGKRPLMGAAADSLADIAIVTSDNPRSEDPEAIIAEIREGMGGEEVVEADRRAAIALGVERAREGDVVVIAGKGHEQGQELAGGRKVPFDDRSVAREALRTPAQGMSA